SCIRVACADLLLWLFNLLGKENLGVDCSCVFSVLKLDRHMVLVLYSRVSAFLGRMCFRFRKRWSPSLIPGLLSRNNRTFSDSCSDHIRVIRPMPLHSSNLSFSSSLTMIMYFL